LNTIHYQPERIRRCLADASILVIQPILQQILRLCTIKVGRTFRNSRLNSRLYFPLPIRNPYSTVLLLYSQLKFIYLSLLFKICKICIYI